MVDITHKNNTLRQAIAEATVQVSSPDTISALTLDQVPKGNVFEMAKAAGLLAVKKTPDLLPDCHPIPIEYSGITYEVEDLQVRIRMEVKTIYKTGVEVEAMHGASVVALTFYDMLKPIDKGVEIQGIRLLSKKGGKTDYREKNTDQIKAGIVVCSDSIANGIGQDKAGKVIEQKLRTIGIESIDYQVIPDEAAMIEQKLHYHAQQSTQLLIYTGGTGLSSRDVTPDTILPLLDREIPGISEVARKYGQDRMPWAMLSRGVAGVKDGMLVLTLPGSTGGARETMDALFPHVLHVFKVLKGKRH